MGKENKTSNIKRRFRALRKEKIFMGKELTEQDIMERIFDSADAVMCGFAMRYDIKADNVRLKIIFLEDRMYKAIMEKKLYHMEVAESNMPPDILYMMKFIVERNEDLIMEEWAEKKRRSLRRRIREDLRSYCKLGRKKK